MAGRGCTTVSPAEGRPLRREPEPPAPASPVSGRAQAFARRYSRPVPGFARGAGLRPQEERRALCRRRLGEPDAWRVGLGWEVWLNGMEITQFTYFQQVGSLDCNPINGDVTYGL